MSEPNQHQAASIPEITQDSTLVQRWSNFITRLNYNERAIDISQRALNVLGVGAAAVALVALKSADHNVFANHSHIAVAADPSTPDQWLADSAESVMVAGATSAIFEGERNQTAADKLFHNRYGTIAARAIAYAAGMAFLDTTIGSAPNVNYGKTIGAAGIGTAVHGVVSALPKGSASLSVMPPCS